MPRKIITDRGTAFTAKVFELYCEENNVQHVKNAVRTPRANGQVERCNRTILSSLKCAHTYVKGQDWASHLRSIQWGLNTAKSSTIRASPHELWFSYTPRDTLGNKLLLELGQQTMNGKDELAVRRDAALQNIIQSQKIQKKSFDQKHRKPSKYEVNDLILIENEPGATGTSRKLEPVFRGPYIVTTVLPNDRFVVEDIPGMQRNQRRFSTVTSSDKMKRWCELPDDPFENAETDDDDNVSTGGDSEDRIIDRMAEL